MTTVTRTTSSSPARTAAIVAGALALACLVFISFMLYSARQADRARSHQATMECLDNAGRGYGPGVGVCIDRAKAGAR